ncbi:MAG: gluconate 2-dehydrogenase subunit 3 family protein [Gammaproteobacteria bacterium]
MKIQKPTGGRRKFLVQAASVAGAGSLVSAGVSAAIAAAAEPTSEPAAASMPYQSLGPDEATFVEALVNIMCPADAYSPSGVECGLATYIDRQLAGPFGKGAGRYQNAPFRSGKPELGLQLPLTPEQFFKVGIAAANEVCVRDRGKPFDQLAAADAERFLQAVQSDHVLHDRVSLWSWFNEVVYRLFVEACFADPMYGGNRNAVFWKMIGYPGLPASHGLDVVRYRGKPYPQAKDPKTLADFT